MGALGKPAKTTLGQSKRVGGKMWNNVAGWWGGEGRSGLTRKEKNRRSQQAVMLRGAKRRCPSGEHQNQGTFGNGPGSILAYTVKTAKRVLSSGLKKWKT